MGFIWSLFAQAGSLWDIWVHSNLLKNKCFEFHPKKFSEPTKQDWFGGIGRGRQSQFGFHPNLVITLVQNPGITSEAKTHKWASGKWFGFLAIPLACFYRLAGYWLATKDRLLQWGLNIDPQCALCRNKIEDKDHLIFQCPFYKRIWKLFRTGAL